MNAALLDKIRKLRALSQSDNVNEAAAAAKLAEWVAKGETIAAVVNRLLARSRP